MTNTEQTTAELDQPNGPGGQRHPHVPGDSHMWVMVLGDLVIFGAYFVIFMIYRTMAPPEFLAAQQHLDVTIGVVNTIVLLTSSWFVARSVLAARAGESRPGHAADLPRRRSSACCSSSSRPTSGRRRSRSGYTMPSNDFFMFYYMLTGVHLFHVALGLLILGIVVRELRNPRTRRMSMVESGAIYWHMVDLLWIVIFALLYVMR